MELKNKGVQVRAFGTAGPPIIGGLELASRFLQGNVVAITGSNGKTTPTSLLGKILADSGRPTLVGGNIGTPVIELINESIRLSGGREGEADCSAALRNDKQNTGILRSAQNDKEVWSVLEVSSFQLETVEEFHPQIAVVLNITPDHLDRHGTFENYAAMKTRITGQQTAEDFLVDRTSTRLHSSHANIS